VTAVRSAPVPTAANAPAVAAPLRAVERVEVSADFHGGLSVRALKRISRDDPYLVGHFPVGTVYPGVFTLETVSQAVMAAVGLCAGKTPTLRVLHSARFLAPLLDGDELLVEARISVVEGDNEFEVDATCARVPDVVCARIRARFGWGWADGA
jgi:3-hydroxyacyl-[acyl-carrier-protein] dehydratase